MRAFALALLMAAPVAAQTVKTVLNNGPVQNRYDIVILGDGYQTSEQAKFDADAQAALDTLFAKPAYGAYKKYFNAHTVFRASRESGADHPDANPPIVRDTVYDATYNYGGTARCLYIRNGGQANADARLAPDVEGRIIVLVNDTRYGGCGGTYSVSYTGSSGPEVQAHEFGHSFGGLADEYDYGASGTYTGPEPSQANITADPTAMAKWPLWIGTNGVGAFQGAGYYLTGLWRPKLDCLMRSLNVALCEVCNEQLVKQAYVTVHPMENRSPAAALVTVQRPATQVFSFTSIVPGAGSIEWQLDGARVATGSASFTLNTASVPSGRHTVRAILKDLTTFVRKDPQALLTGSETWTVDVLSTRPGSYTSYGSGCQGTAGVPTLSAAGVPEIGASFAVNLSSAPALRSATLLLGASNTKWIALNLPFDLRPLGAAGCSVLTSGEITVGVTTSPFGLASVPITIPNDLSIVDSVFFDQFYVIDPAANQLGITWSNGGRGQIGRP
jgi:hypothetical protein